MADDDKDLLELCKKRFKRCLDDPSEESNRKRALEAIKFRALEQWPDKVKHERENDPEGSRPCLVMDETNQYINQVKNDFRQNRPAIKVRPVDDKGDKDVAEAFQGLIRNIEEQSSADIAYDTGFDQALDGGFGYFRVVTEYSDDTSFDQDIRIKPIKNRFAVYLDPDRQLPDGSDAEFGFITEWVKKEEYERSYPKSKVSSWKEGEEGDANWHDGDNVRVVEYFYVEYTKRTMIALPNGEIAYEDEWSEDAGPIPKELKTRVVQQRKICWVKTNGEEVLEKQDWPGKWIPIVEVIGNEIDIEGKSKKSGILEAAMDPQRMHNYSVSAFVEQVALAPRAPFTAYEGQLEGHENEWRTANRRNISVLQVKAVNDESGNILPLPQRQPSPGIPPGWAAIVEGSKGWVQSSMGMYAASVGAPSNEKSGRAILARQREGDTATFHYADNMAKSIRHCGRIIVDLIPKIYDTRRIVRLLEEDGAEDYAVFDPSIQGPKVEQKLSDGTIRQIFNPTIGKYDVTISVGPSYTTKRQEGAEMMTQVLSGNKEMMALIGDIYFRILDVPYGDQIADRLKAMLPPPVKAVEDAKSSENPEVAMLQQQFQMQMEQIRGEAGQMIEQLQGELQQVSGTSQEQKLKIQELQVMLKDRMAEYATRIQEAEIERDTKITEAQIQAQSKIQETQPEPKEPVQPQQPVTVMDSSLAGPFDSMGQGLQLVAQSVQQTNQLLAQTAEINAKQSEFLAQLAMSIAKQSGPRRITLPDGSVAMTEPMMQ